MIKQLQTFMVFSLIHDSKLVKEHISESPNQDSKALSFVKSLILEFHPDSEDLVNKIRLMTFERDAQPLKLDQFYTSSLKSRSVSKDPSID